MHAAQAASQRRGVVAGRRGFELKQASRHVREAIKALRVGRGALIADDSEQAAAAVHGLVFIFLSCFLFSGVSLCVIFLTRAFRDGSGGSPPLIALIARFVAQAALSAAAIAALRRERGLALPGTWLGSPRARFFMVSRGVWGVGGLTCWVLSLDAMSLADATAIVYLNIPLAAIFARLLLREEYTAVDAATGAAALAGAVLVAQPEALFGGAAAGGGAQPVSAAAVAVALLGAVCSAMAYVSARHVGPGEDVLVTVLLFALLGCAAAPVLAAAGGAFAAPPPDARALLLLSGVGVLGWAGQLLLNAGLTRAPSGPAAGGAGRHAAPRGAGSGAAGLGG
jgi:drug/metabolite transporter (DMT)-like permease